MRASGNRSRQRGDGRHFLLAAQHAALELEIAESRSGLARPRRGARWRPASAPASSRRRSQSSLGVRLRGDRQVGVLAAVADVEQVAQHLHRRALLAFAEQRGTPARRETGRADPAAPPRPPSRHGLRRAGRRSAGRARRRRGRRSSARIALRMALYDGDRSADDQRPRVFQGLPDGFAAGHLADPGVAGAVFAR